MRSNDRDLHYLKEQKEVFLDSDQPFEAPAKDVVPGPYYSNIEEVMPELSEAEGGDEDGKKLAVDRRDFMRLFGAGAAMASAACVRRPVEKAIPYVDQPIDQIPGVPTNYATTIDGTGVIVKTREGRPVFIEGNPAHPLSQGTTTALAMSELQALYHPDRRKAPIIQYGTNRRSESGWDDVYSRLAAKISGSKKVGILAKPTTGHSVDFYKEFLRKIGQSEDSLYFYETNALRNNMAAAYKMAFGESGYPRSDLKQSEVIVGIGSDFMDVGTSTVFETKSWSGGQAYKFGRKGRFVQFESRLTNTGGKADERHPIAPGDELGVTLALVKALMANSASKGSVADKARIQKVLNENTSLIASVETKLKVSLFAGLAKELLTSKSVVMVGESSGNSKNGTLVQLAGIFANILVGAYENKTLVYDFYWMRTSSDGNDIQRFLKDADSLDTLIVINVNPAFTLPASTGIKDILSSIDTVASIQSMPCETDEYAEFVLNGHNALESWGDEQLVQGFWSMIQPTVRPFTNSRQAEDILLWTAAHLKKPMGVAEYREYIQAKWKGIHKANNVKHDFETFFNAILRKGLYGEKQTRTLPALRDVSTAFTKHVIPGTGMKLVAHLDPRLLDGVGADRPVLQESGDSITTIAWDTWIAINPLKARELGFKYNDVITVKGPGGSFDAAVYPMPGLHHDTVAVPRGNGHKAGISRATTGVGVDPLVALGAEYDVVTGDPVTSGQVVELVATGRRYRLAAQQKHNDIANRTDILKEVGLQEIAKKDGKVHQALDEVPDMFPKLKEHPDYRWGMSIDLDKCNGCGACTVACDLENNVPQVGREQILLGREMHWMRVDRYFKGAVDNPEVSFQPVACQHCNHAPCEAVCPVFATTHDEEGMNNQTYNRCVGTRYCANACPYKVRRFNWFTHKWNVMGDRPVDRNPRALNPDVTVRTRGIMEKCTYCVQRIREAKHRASEQGRLVQDREIRTACEVSCPTNAIVFGNLKNKNSEVARERRNYRSFLMLGGDPMHKHYGIKTLPNTSYMAKVMHKTSSDSQSGHHESGDQG